MDRNLVRTGNPKSDMSVRTFIADYGNPEHAAAIVQLLDSYASDPMGGGHPLGESVKENLVSELGKIPGAFSVLCYVGQQPAGLVNCFMGFSSFSCKPLVNIHDIVTAPAFRGRGLSQAMMETVEREARQRGCGKMTLEVLEGNTVAQAAYRKFGFDAYQLDPQMGKALFWQKTLV